MKRSRDMLDNVVDMIDINPPKKKKRKLNGETISNVNDESNNTLNTNNKKNEIQESKDNDFEDIAFYLTKSPLIENNDGKYKFNKYSLFLDEIITTSSPSSVIEKCIIFSFKIDPEWIFESCPILKNQEKVEEIYMFHGESVEEHYNLCNYQLIYHHLKLFKIKMNFSFGTHHTKMIMLLYKNEGIRIMITSANMIQRDWCYKINGIYLQDFPLKDTSNTNSNHTSASDFASTLYLYCNQLHGLNNKCIMDFNFLNNYDFSSAKILLIPSVPGYHKHNTQTFNLFGHRRLRYLLSKYDVKTNHDNLVLNISSIGSLTQQWLMDEFFQQSFHGDNNKIGNNLKLLWPTTEDVRNSIEGYAAGGSLCFSKKCCKPFLFQYFNKYNAEISGRRQLMPHIKTYSVINVKQRKLRFFILTSANLSTAAWGKLQKNNSQIFIRSFEMGCLYLPDVFINNYMKHRHRGFNLTDLPFKNIKRNLNTNNEYDINMDDVEFEILYQVNISKNKSSNGNKRKIIFPMPMEILETQNYQKQDKPWIWDLQYEKPDMYGERWPRQ